MEIIKLIGVLIVVIGFILKLDTLAVVVVAGLATGLVAGMSPMDILNTLGTAFITNRTATLFILTLPVIGLCERNGLKDKAVDFIRSLKNMTTGKLIAIWQVIRTFASAFSLRVGGHPQFIRPTDQSYGPGSSRCTVQGTGREIRRPDQGMCAGSEKLRQLLCTNCFMDLPNSSDRIHLKRTGYPVDALQIAGQSVPIAVISAVTGIIYALIFDQILKRRLASKATKEDK